MQVLHFNMHRIYDLWGIFLSHVLEVLASAKAALRTAAMDAVGKAITGALDRPVPARECRRAHCEFGRDSWQKPVHGMPATRRRVLTHMCCVSWTEAAAVGCALVEPEICAMLAETDGTASTAEAEGGVENMLLVALTSLYTDEREADVRLGVLRVAINVLQRHGASPYAAGRQIPKRPPGFHAHP